MSSNDEKKILQAQYETMIRYALQNQKKYTPAYKKVVSVAASFLLSCFFTWCSSGSTSYFPTLFSENAIVRYIVCYLPFLFIIVYEISIGISAKKIAKMIDLEAAMSIHSWKKRFVGYILKKVEYEPNDDIVKSKSLLEEKLNKHGEFIIDLIDFEEYLVECYKEYKLDVYFDFYQHLAKVILLEYEIEGTLTCDKGQYIYAAQNNIDNLLMVSTLL